MAQRCFSAETDAAAGVDIAHEALGFGMGDVVLLEILKARDRLPKFDSPMDVYVLIEDEALRSHSLKLIHDLRAAGYAVEYPLTPTTSDKQFKRALELHARYTFKLERNADGELVVKLKNLSTREEKMIVFGEGGAAPKV